MENKLGITEGIAIVKERDTHFQLDVYIGDKRACEFKSFSDERFNDTTINEADVNANLYADAHNTANKCNKLPSTLLGENEEMREMLKEAIGYRIPWQLSEQIQQLLTKIDGNG